MAIVAAPKTALSYGAGILYWAPPGAAAPSTFATVVASGSGSAFSGDWTANGWFALGVTTEGHTLNVEFNFDAVEAAEYDDPLINVMTGRTITCEAEIMQVHLTNFRRIFNAPSSNLTTSGSGSTLRTAFTLPRANTVAYCQLGWESSASDERWWSMQARNTGSVGIQRRKGADNATLPVTFTFEPDASGEPVYFDSAGTLRG
jgi:hypothetical protein